jgi:hypothetical protein
MVIFLLEALCKDRSNVFLAHFTVYVAMFQKVFNGVDKVFSFFFVETKFQRFDKNFCSSSLTSVSNAFSITHMTSETLSSMDRRLENVFVTIRRADLSLNLLILTHRV